MSNRSVREPAERLQFKRERRTAAELVEAIKEDEKELGRPMSRGERAGFARGFFGVEHTAEVRLLEALGLLEGTGPE